MSTIGVDIAISDKNGLVQLTITLSEVSAKNARALAEALLKSADKAEKAILDDVIERNLIDTLSDLKLQKAAEGK